MTPERETEQKPRTRASAVETLQEHLDEERAEAKFRRFISLPDRAEEFVKHEYAKYITTHLGAILEKGYEETVVLNISECDKDDELEELVGGRMTVDDEGKVVEPIHKGKIDGIEMVLKHLSGVFPLRYYKRDDMERFELEGEVDNWGINYSFPTSIEGVSVCYFYPDDPHGDIDSYFEEDIDPEAKQIPTISLRIDPLTS